MDPTTQRNTSCKYYYAYFFSNYNSIGIPKHRLGSRNKVDKEGRNIFNNREMLRMTIITTINLDILKTATVYSFFNDFHRHHCQFPFTGLLETVKPLSRNGASLAVATQQLAVLIETLHL